MGGQTVSPHLEVRAIKASLAARTVIWTITILARLQEGPATTAELRRAAWCKDDSFRLILQDLRRRGQIVSTPHPERGKYGVLRALWMLP